MTQPILALSSTKEIGRLYQTPNGTYTGTKLSKVAAREGLMNKTLAPSITNVIGGMNKNLEGYATYMMGLALRAGKTSYEAQKEYITYRDMCAVRGSRVHLAIEDFINEGFAAENYFTFQAHKKYMLLPSYKAMEAANKADNDLIYFHAFLQFIKQYKPEFVAQEATVYGKTEDGLGYAGTTDFIAEINGKLIVGDWKTSSKMSTTVALQLAAVIKATHITTDFKNLLRMYPVDAAWGIHLGKDGKFGVYEADIEAGWREFQSLRRIWNHYAFEGNYVEDAPMIRLL